MEIPWVTLCPPTVKEVKVEEDAASDLGSLVSQ